MSGGSFNYLQKRYEWDECVEKIQNIINNNEYDYSEKTIEEFKIALDIIKKARIYMQRVDYLVSSDDSEDSFHKRLQEELKNI